MSVPTVSSSETKMVISPSPQWQKPSPKSRQNQRKLFYILAFFVILALGCATPASFSPSQDKTPESKRVVVSKNKDIIPVQVSQPIADQEITERPTLAEFFVIRDISTPTPFLLPEPTSTSDPTATPTVVIIDTPTASPTPLPSATSLPTATDVPTLTATPAPTATEPPTATPTAEPETALQPDIKHVIIISIDGLRPDALDLAHTPTLDDLKSKGSYSPYAQTVSLAVTLPSHASMLSGMTMEKHGIEWGLPYLGWPGMNGPTVFNVAHDAGLSTAMVFGKEKLNYIALPNSVDKLFGVDAHDDEVKEHAVEFIQAGLPNVLFIHFPDTDHVGHAYGWMSENQFYSITYVDALIGEIVAELERGDYLDSTLMIITADHGGRGFGHGDDSPLDRTIPWLATGPGVSSGVILGSHINTYDTAATALYALGLPIPENWDGQPIHEIFQQE